MAYTITTIEDESQWEWFVLSKSPNALFQSWQWGEVQKKLGMVVSRFGVYKDKELCGVFGLVEVRARRGSFLHVRHGPILAHQSSSLWKEIFRFLKSEALMRRVWFVRMNPVLPETEELKELFSSNGLQPAAIHRMDGEQCWVLDLLPSEEELLSGMRKTTRYEIKRAAKSGVEVFSTTNPVYLKEFFALYEQTSTRHGFVPHSGIEQEFNIFSKKNQAMLYLGKVDNKTIASAIILFYGNQAIYHHGASIPSKVPASYLIQWEAIREAKKRGMNVYNFWGIAPEDSKNHPWRGITLFKKGFGGHQVDYIHAHDLPISPLYALSRSVELVRRISRGYD